LPLPLPLPFPFTLHTSHFTLPEHIWMKVHHSARRLLSTAKIRSASSPGPRGSCSTISSNESNSASATCWTQTARDHTIGTGNEPLNRSVNLQRVWLAAELERCQEDCGDPGALE